MSSCLDKHEYAKWDEKFFWLGYNHFFDKKWISAFFKRHSDKPMHDYTNWYPIEVYSNCAQAAFLCDDSSEELPNLQLGTVCAKANVEINAHDAFSDSLATLKLWVQEMEIKTFYKGKQVSTRDNWNDIITAEEM